MMSKTFTVKARIHYGTRGLDITIPAKIVKDKEINPGDIFKVESEITENSLVIKFIRVYKNK